MSTTVAIACECGQVKGELDILPNAHFHVHCLCCDCQNFASYLDQEEQILDEHGGTELFQTYPSALRFNQGEQYIEAIQFKQKGLYRWHTSCCKSPLANTMASSGVPFVGVVVNCLQFVNEEQKLSILGPVSMKAFGKYAKGEMPSDAHPRFSMSAMPKILWFMLKGLIGKKQKGSPFFANGKPAFTIKKMY